MSDMPETSNALRETAEAEEELLEEPGTEEENCCPCCARKKHREDKEIRDLINRLNRIEGQVRGIRGMVEQDAYCIDIINQVAAATAALNSFNRVLLTNHMMTCVTDDIRAGRGEKMDELARTMQKLMK